MYVLNFPDWPVHYEGSIEERWPPAVPRACVELRHIDGWTQYCCIFVELNCYLWKEEKTNVTQLSPFICFLLQLSHSLLLIVLLFTLHPSYLTSSRMKNEKNRRKESPSFFLHSVHLSLSPFPVITHLSSPSYLTPITRCCIFHLIQEGALGVKHYLIIGSWRNKYIYNNTGSESAWGSKRRRKWKQ